MDGRTVSTQLVDQEMRIIFRPLLEFEGWWCVAQVHPSILVGTQYYKSLCVKYIYPNSA